MGSAANPFFGQNALSVNGSGGSSSTSANPYTLPFSTGASPSSASANPYSTSGLSFAADSGGYSSAPVSPTAPVTGPTSVGQSGQQGNPTSGVGASLGVPTNSTGQNQLLYQLNKTYGAGMGTTLYNFLAGGAGYNQQAINNMLASMQPGFNQDQQNLMQQFSAGGNRFGSGAQIGLSNLESQEQLDVGQVESQMYEQSVNDFINTLMGTGSESAQRVSSAQGSGGLGGLLSMLTGGAGDVSSLITGLDPNADTGILDAIAGMG